VTRWLWSAPDGSVTDLSAWSAGTYVIDDGTSGQLAPEYEFQSQGFAGVDGETLQQITAQPAAPTLAMDLVASDGVELRNRVRALAHVLRPRAGMGTLRAVADDGTERRLPCYYRKGLESGTYRVTRYRTALQFWSPFPWWRGDPVTLDYGLAAPAPFFPVTPVRLSTTTIAGVATVDLSGTDAPTFPRWTVTGPGTQLTLSNTYTAVQLDGTVAPVTQSLVLNAPIGDGQVVAIDTRPSYQSVRRADGTNLFGSLASDPALWSLVDGVNSVSAVLTGAGPASRITCTADRLYSGAL
jgi:hypothetical protein